MRKQFGETILRLAESDDRVVLVTGDVEQEMESFKERYPTRFFNLGLCEQAIIGIAAGLAMEGMRPVVYSITPFLLERPFEQIKIDIDQQNLPVLLIGYADYPTHGPTHRPLNAEGLIALFENVHGYFPKTAADVGRDILAAYGSESPSIVCLKKDASK